MKRIIFIVAILLSTLGLKAQKDTTFYRHEVRASAGGAILATVFWTAESWGDRRFDAALYANVSFAYFYRPVKWFWVGGNFVNYAGDRIYYNMREYYPDGRFRDFEKSKIKYCAAIAPEIRFSYLNRKSVILYSALSGGIGWENGYDFQYRKYPKKHGYFQITYFGFSCNFGKNRNGFIGGELGIGFKDFLCIHGGYRF